MPKDKLFTAAVCRAAAACFEVGDTLKGVAAALDTNDMRVRRALERGRREGAPAYLAAMASAYDWQTEALDHRRRALARARAAGVAEPVATD